jgi:hypothetical protein
MYYREEINMVKKLLKMLQRTSSCEEAITFTKERLAYFKGQDKKY